MYLDYFLSKKTKGSIAKSLLVVERTILMESALLLSGVSLPGIPEAANIDGSQVRSPLQAISNWAYFGQLFQPVP